MTVFASLATFLIRRTLATEPARRVGPCITLASSSTSPSSFGNPPYPTESSFGSSSTTVTAASAASSVSPPLFKISMPFCSACTPFALEIIAGRFPLAAAICGTNASASDPSPGVDARNKFVLPAAAVPTSDVKKNLRRDHKLMPSSSIHNGCNDCEAPLYKQRRKLERTRRDEKGN